MDFSLTPALKSLQAEVRTFIAEHIIPLEKTLDKLRTVPRRNCGRNWWASREKQVC